MLNDTQRAAKREFVAHHLNLARSWRATMEIADTAELHQLGDIASREYDACLARANAWDPYARPENDQ